MKEICLDIGTIQAFLDSELTHDERTRVSEHIAMCDKCSLMLADAEDESAVVFSVLEREFNTLVPTQRLWNKINDSIATERDARPFWQKVYGFLTVALLNPSMAGAAVLLIFGAIFAAVWMNRNAVPTDVAVVSNPAQQGTSPASVAGSPGLTAAANDRKVEPSPDYRVERAAYRPETRRPSLTPAAVNALATSPNGYLPGEESYVRTISSLAKTVEEQKEGGIMRPSERIAYERDMAVVNDAITKMKIEVKRNPRNESAKQVLYSSYQNKIDLLNSVSQKEELLVSLK